LPTFLKNIRFVQYFWRGHVVKQSMEGQMPKNRALALRVDEGRELFKENEGINKLLKVYVVWQTSLGAWKN